MTNWPKKGCSTPLILREMQIKTLMRYFLTLVRVATVKMSTNNKCWRGCGEKVSLLHCWSECKLVQPLWKTTWRSLKKLKTELSYDPATPLLIISRHNYNSKRYMYPCSQQHYSQQPRYGKNLDVHRQRNK